MTRLFLASLLVTLILPCLALAGVRSSTRIPTEGKDDLYVFNRQPLLPNGLAKLPIGAIRPSGWLEQQLRLMTTGMTGRLSEVSHFLASDSGWLEPSKPGWEELPYWLKGYGDLGYILGDHKIRKEAMRWLDAIFASQDSDGYFGPQANKKNNDIWPNMVVLYAMQSLHEATADSRVIPFMLRYCRWLDSLPIDGLLPESWQKTRAGDQLESIYWLYNRTNEPWLLSLAKKVHERTDDWTHTIASNHGVNFCQSFRQPAVYYQQARDSSFLNATEKRYREMMSEYGQVPGGMFGADENTREGRTGPEQAAETCSIVEFMNSNQSLLRITGDLKYADRCEDIAFNSLPASMDPELKGLHYLTAPNQVMLDRAPVHCYQNQGKMLPYSALEVYRCCQHNVAQGWPYFAEHLWMATKDGGLAAVLFAPCEVTARVASGQTVTVKEETIYPFGDTLRFTISTASPVTFPLSVRIPEWCTAAAVRINGSKVDASAGPQSYLTLEREWTNGDTVEVRLPMEVRTVRWAKHGGALSVARGPFWYSLKIGEKYTRFVDDPKFANWPETEVLPQTPWNYALVVDPADPAKSFAEGGSDSKMAAQPYLADAAFLTLKAKARRLPSWELVKNCPGPVPSSPTQTAEPLEEITLIPMGCARLRVTVFPVAEK